MASLFYAQGGATAPNHQARPIPFPVVDKRTEASDRVAYLATKLAQDGYSLDVAGVPAAQQADRLREESRWYGVSQGRDSCIGSPMSPADRIKVVQEAGITPKVRDTMVAGKLAMVEIVADDGRHETTWRFWKSKAECERTLASKAIPDRYK